MQDLVAKMERDHYNTMAGKVSLTQCAKIADCKFYDSRLKFYDSRVHYSRLKFFNDRK